MSIKLQVVTRTQDNGDGGYTSYVYNTMDELLADHPRNPSMRFMWSPIADDRWEEVKQEILDGENEYEHGYIDRSTIELEQNADGSYRLAKPLSFHAGQ